MLEFGLRISVSVRLRKFSIPEPPVVEVRGSTGFRFILGVEDAGTNGLYMAR